MWFYRFVGKGLQKTLHTRPLFGFVGASDAHFPGEIPLFKFLRRHPHLAAGESLEVGFVKAEGDGDEIVPIAEENMVRSVGIPEEYQPLGVMGEVVHKVFLDFESLERIETAGVEDDLHRKKKESGPAWRRTRVWVRTSKPGRDGKGQSGRKRRSQGPCQNCQAYDIRLVSNEMGNARGSGQCCAAENS